MVRCLLMMMTLFAALGMTSCYQIHSDDDLRTVPVTNNPNIVPQQGSKLPGASM